MSNTMKNHTQVLIIGAGAAGLMCAAMAGAKGLSVRVLDHANKPGKKILMSGGGRCNFTNYEIEPGRYLGHNPHFCKSALSRYTQWDFIALVDKHGIAWHEKKDGQLFCDNKSSDILAMLLAECDAAGVDIRLETRVNSVASIHRENSADTSGYRLVTSNGDFFCDRLVIATGGPSIPTLGATGFGYQLARQFELNVFEPVAALVPFTITDHFSELCKTLSGSSCRVRVSSGKQSFLDDMLFTHRGLSGPAMLQISSYWSPGQSLEIDLLPEMDVAVELRKQQHQQPRQLLKTWLGQALTQKTAECWLAVMGWDPMLTLASLNGEQMDKLGSQLNQWQLKPSGTEGYRTAEVALGGVDTDELSSRSMEVKKQPGLYFIGEVVDVTGHLGGFNFQWAWSSAYAASEHIGEVLCI
jgi:predicted Rossmann fold flavoprotein